jgi:hypothetical protein
VGIPKWTSSIVSSGIPHSFDHPLDPSSATPISPAHPGERDDIKDIPAQRTHSEKMADDKYASARFGYDVYVSLITGSRSQGYLFYYRSGF